METTEVFWNRPGFLIRRLQQIQVAIFLEECGDKNITPVQWGVLSMVSESPGVGHIEISEVLGLDRSNVANVVTRLAKRRLLRQKTSKTDRRRKDISITNKGSELVEEVQARALRAQWKLLSPLNESEKIVFLDLMGRLVRKNNHLGRTRLKLE